MQRQQSRRYFKAIVKAAEHSKIAGYPLPEICMPKKNELTLLMAKVLLKLSSESPQAWDQSYCRFLAHDPTRPSFEFVIRWGRTIYALPVPAEYTELLTPLMQSLFDEMQVETTHRPLLAVLTVDTAKAYKLKLEYNNPQAHDISVQALGTATSYFAKDEVDMPPRDQSRF